MTSYYISSPEKKHSSTFIVSTDGVGFSRGQYRLVSVQKCKVKGKGKTIYTLYFKFGQEIYECCPAFSRRKRRVVVKVGKRVIEAPSTLRPFADPATFIKQI